VLPHLGMASEPRLLSVRMGGILDRRARRLRSDRHDLGAARVRPGGSSARRRARRAPRYAEGAALAAGCAAASRAAVAGGLLVRPPLPLRPLPLRAAGLGRRRWDVGPGLVVEPARASAVVAALSLSHRATHPLQPGQRTAGPGRAPASELLAGGARGDRR